MYTFFCILLLKFIMIYKYMCLFEMLRSVLTQVQNLFIAYAFLINSKFRFSISSKKSVKVLLSYSSNFLSRSCEEEVHRFFGKENLFLCPIEFCVFICWHKMDFWLTFQCLFQVLSTDCNELPPRRKLTSDKPNVNHFSIQRAFIFFKLWTHIFFCFVLFAIVLINFQGFQIMCSELMFKSALWLK